MALGWYFGVFLYDGCDSIEKGNVLFFDLLIFFYRKRDTLEKERIGSGFFLDYSYGGILGTILFDVFEPFLESFLFAFLHVIADNSVS